MSDRAPRNSKLPWLLVAAVAIVIVATMVYMRSGPGEPPVPAADGVEAASDPSASRSPDPSRNPPQPRSQLSRDAMEQRKRIISEKRKQVQDNVDRTQAAFASRYGSEPVDASWATIKQAELTKLAVSDQISELGVEPKNMSVDCKTTMCRVTADFASMSAGDDWFTLYMGNVGTKVPVASYKYVQNPDGTVSINLYALGRR